MFKAKEMQRKKKGKRGIEPEWMRRYPQITRAQAIQVFCRECLGYTKHRGGGSESQAWKMAGQMAKECSDKLCPLYRFRPGARGGLKLVSKTP